MSKPVLQTSFKPRTGQKAFERDVGTLTGTLVLQRCLPYFKYEYPELLSMWTDFSDAPGLFNQTENTRIIIKPATQTYDATLDSSGRPNGFATASPAQAVDVPVTLSEYIGVPIIFGNQTLASTMRRLFDEQGPMVMYAFAQYFRDLQCDGDLLIEGGEAIGIGAG